MWLFLNWVYFHKFFFSCFSIKFFLNYQPVLTTLQGNREEGVCSHLGRAFIRVRGQGQACIESRTGHGFKIQGSRRKAGGSRTAPCRGRSLLRVYDVGCVAVMKGLLSRPPALESHKEPTSLLKDECTFGYAERRDRRWSEKFLIKEEFLGFQLNIH